MESEEKNARPYFIAIIVLFVFLAIGILMFFLMPETVEKIMYGTDKNDVNRIDNIQNNRQNPITQQENSDVQIKGVE